MRGGQKTVEQCRLQRKWTSTGIKDAMWVGLVNTGGSVDVKVGGVDIVSAIVMWVSGTGKGVDTRWCALGGEVDMRVNVVDIGDGMT